MTENVALMEEARRILVEERRKIASSIIDAKAKGYTTPSTYASNMVGIQAAVQALDQAIADERAIHRAESPPSALDATMPEGWTIRGNDREQSK
ncbi:hypothetical protein L6654_08535 [Bradyrhizobium sp. WYCCWR 13023]|uniref:Uncharacterized protein n=1 Tax=Bradyrhizobium zhengyangense TaxID=2911009 RepID=A0A9X1R7Y3_9BRAD|nr:hypothetical protein [Bradyrhizobium zhengyangense]MCG2626667.1 hypothetical protein [Bradyrhizobium zhengyangense]